MVEYAKNAGPPGAQVHSAAGCGELEAECLVLWFQPAGADAQLGAPVAQLIERAQRARVVRADLSADDMPMIWCTIGAAQRQSGDERWERYLELMLDGLRAH